MLRKVDRILLQVPNVASAAAYYRDVLGLKLLRLEPRRACLRLNDDATELLLHNDPDLPAEEFYYLVDDVNDLFRRRQELRLKFLSAPAQATRGRRAVVRDPFGNVLRLLDRSGAQSAATAVEDGAAPAALFHGIESHLPTKRALLIDLYQKTGRTADDLPYTAHFQALYGQYAAAHPEPKPTEREVWRQLLNLRKGGKLPKLGEARSQPPQIPEEDRTRLRQMLGPDIGRRDRLPYTDRFENLVDEFNRRQARPLSPHLVWRLIATLAK